MFRRSSAATKQSEVVMEVDETPASFTTQILLVYYVLLYQDLLLNNMKTIGNNNNSNNNNINNNNNNTNDNNNNVWTIYWAVYWLHIKTVFTVCSEKTLMVESSLFFISAMQTKV